MNKKTSKKETPSLIVEDEAVKIEQPKNIEEKALQIEQPRDTIKEENSIDWTKSDKDSFIKNLLKWLEVSNGNQ